MTNKDLVALADAIRIHNRTADARTELTPDHLNVLAEFFASQDARFNQERWIDSITTDCERTRAAGATTENKVVPIANHDESGPKSGLAALDRSKIVSSKPR